MIDATVKMISPFGIFGNGAGNGAIGWNGTGLSGVTDISSSLFSGSGGGTFDGYGSFAVSLDGPPASGAVSSLSFDINMYRWLHVRDPGNGFRRSCD